MPRRTKIVATLGPATDDPDVLAALLNAGVDVARINFSHGDEADHLARVQRFRDVAERLGRTVAVLADLPGPKLRVRIPAARQLKVGDVIHFTQASVSTGDDIAITEPEMLADVRPGHRILLDDGRLQLRAGDLAAGRLAATVIVGGMLLENKGLNLPDTPLTIPAVTDRDREAVAIAAKAKVDWLALSFVRGPDAAIELRGTAAVFGLKVPIIAKMERPEAVQYAAAIVAAFDGIMVARGDLGVEIPLERVPYVQKQLIAEARAAGKPVITATDMLDSMRTNPRPTRAEASDVANAILDGTDAVMLSGETAVGKYPVESVACMARIAAEAETHLDTDGDGFLTPVMPRALGTIEDAMARTACHLAHEAGATAIVTPTISGRTAKLLARYRPQARIVAPSSRLATLQRLAVVWGVRPVPMTALKPGDGRMVVAVRDAFAAGALTVGERVVVLALHPLEGEPMFPTVRVVRVGDGGASLEP